MSSHYKKIDGVSYDRAMLETADKNVNNKDGKISLDGAKAIIKSMQDGGRVTDTEVRTLNYILENYKLTEPALKYIEDSLSDDLNSKDKEDINHDKLEPPQEKDQQSSEPSKKSKTSKIKYLLIFLLILIVLLIIFLLSNFSCGKDANKDNLIAEQKTVTEGKTATETKTNTTDNKNLKNNTAANESKNKNEINKNKYVVKKNDTLTRISRAVYGDYALWKNIYNANKDKIKNPNLVREGQVIAIPEKNR